MEYRLTPKLLSDRNTSWKEKRDIQGITWESEVMQYTKERMRTQRREYYRPFRNCTDQLDEAIPTSTVNSDFFEFTQNYADFPCSYIHFQLRDNVKCFSREKISWIARSSINEFNLLSEESTTIKQMRNKEIYSFDMKENLIVSGGSEAELHVDTLQGEELLQTVISDSNNSRMTNLCTFFPGNQGYNILTCCNDCKIRILDPQYVKFEEYTFAECVNYSSLSEDANLIASAMDSTTIPVLDRRTGSIELSLNGHKDFSLQVQWDPQNPALVSSCNQDRTVRVWDIRTQKALHVLFGEMAGILKMSYSPNGKYLAFAEAADFVHIYDTRSYEQKQQIELFGDLAGLTFSPEGDSKTLYIGVSDRSFSSLLEFRQRTSNKINAY